VRQYEYFLGVAGVSCTDAPYILDIFLSESPLTIQKSTLDVHISDSAIVLTVEVIDVRRRL
jgi:hypothetical protein